VCPLLPAPLAVSSIYTCNTDGRRVKSMSIHEQSGGLWKSMEVHGMATPAAKSVASENL